MYNASNIIFHQEADRNGYKNEGVLAWSNFILVSLTKALIEDELVSWSL